MKRGLSVIWRLNLVAPLTRKAIFWWWEERSSRWRGFVVVCLEVEEREKSVCFRWFSDTNNITITIL